MSYDSPMLQGSKVGPPSRQVLETEIDGDISLYDPMSEHVTVLNSTASDVWRLADGESSVEEITSLLATAYGVEESSISRDVVDTVDQLRDQGLIEST